MSNPGLITVEVDIDGDHYWITKMPGIEAVDMSALLMQKLGPALPVVFGVLADKDKVKDLETNLAPLAGALTQILPSLDRQTLHSIYEPMFKNVRVKNAATGNLDDLGNKDTLDSLYRGRAWSFYKVLIRTIMVNFFSFGPGRGAAGGTSPQTATP